MDIQSVSPLRNVSNPDVAIIRSSRNAIKDQLINLHDIYLPSLQEKLDSLDNKLNSVEDCTQKTLALTPQQLLRSTVQLSLQPLLQDTSPQTRAMRESYAKEVIDNIHIALRNVNNQKTKLSTPLDDLDVLGSEDGSNLIDDMEQEINNKQTELDSIIQQHGNLQKDKDILNSALQVFEDKNLFEELLPLVDAIKHLNPRNPAVSAIRAAVAGVQNILRIASESVKYSDLVTARAELQKRLDSRIKQMSDLRQRISELSKRSRQLKILPSLEQHRVNYEQEIRKISTTLNSFLNELRDTSPDNVIEYAQTFLTKADALAAYLEDLRRRWK